MTPQHLHYIAVISSILLGVTGGGIGLGIANSGINKDEVHQFNFLAGKGCGHCRGTGFKGRKAIAELLIMNDELREMIANRQSIKAIKEAAVRFNTKFLRESALALVKNGETTLQEINRVTFVA